MTQWIKVPVDVGLLLVPVPQWDCNRCDAHVAADPRSGLNFDNAIHVSTERNAACGGTLVRCAIEPPA